MLRKIFVDPDDRAWIAKYIRALRAIKQIKSERLPQDFIACHFCLKYECYECPFGAPNIPCYRIPELSYLLYRNQTSMFPNELAEKVIKHYTKMFKRIIIKRLEVDNGV